MKIYDCTYNGNNHQEAIAYALGMDWSEVETVEVVKPYRYSGLITKLEGVAVWYDYGADYYYFEELDA